MGGRGGGSPLQARSGAHPRTDPLGSSRPGIQSRKLKRVAEISRFTVATFGGLAEPCRGGRQSPAAPPAPPAARSVSWKIVRLLLSPRWCPASRGRSAVRPAAAAPLAAGAAARTPGAGPAQGGCGGGGVALRSATAQLSVGGGEWRPPPASSCALGHSDCPGAVLEITAATRG